MENGNIRKHVLLQSIEKNEVKIGMKTIILITLTLSISCGDLPENNEVCRLLSEA